MPARWLAAVAVTLVTWPPGLYAAEPPAPAQTAAAEPLPIADALLATGLALFKERKFAAAAAELEKARRQTTLHEDNRSYALLLLGTCYYRLGELDRAEALLREVVRTGDADLQATARVFLAMVFAEQGASDRARAELGNAARSPYLRDAAERLLQHSRPHRLQLTLLVSPEYDGNVPLTSLAMDTTNYPAWRTNPLPSMDGDVLFLASVGVRPLANGLLIGNTFSYRQQLRVTDFNLLLDSTWLGYSYYGPSDRLRILTSFNFAMLGGSTLFLDGSAKASYRRRLVQKLGLTATFDVRYRNYLHADYLALTGLTQLLQLDLGWGLSPQPLSFGFSYQGLREQTQAPNPADPAAQDFRAWAHGPSVWLRARLHTRVELALATTLLLRVFDGGGRVDYTSYNDLNLNITLKSWLAAFVGGSAIYNSSTSALFHYFKPTASAGLAVYFGLL